MFFLPSSLTRCVFSSSDESYITVDLISPWGNSTPSVPHIPSGDPGVPFDLFDEFDLIASPYISNTDVYV